MSPGRVGSPQRPSAARLVPPGRVVPGSSPLAPPRCADLRATHRRRAPETGHPDHRRRRTGAPSDDRHPEPGSAPPRRLSGDGPAAGADAGDGHSIGRPPVSDSAGRTRDRSSAAGTCGSREGDRSSVAARLSRPARVSEVEHVQRISEGPSAAARLQARAGRGQHGGDTGAAFDVEQLVVRDAGHPRDRAAVRAGARRGRPGSARRGRAGTPAPCRRPQPPAGLGRPGRTAGRVLPQRGQRGAGGGLVQPGGRAAPQRRRRRRCRPARTRRSTGGRRRAGDDGRGAGTLAGGGQWGRAVGSSRVSPRSSRVGGQGPARCWQHRVGPPAVVRVVPPAAPGTVLRRRRRALSRPAGRRRTRRLPAGWPARSARRAGAVAAVGVRARVTVAVAQRRLTAMSAASRRWRRMGRSQPSGV